MKKPHTPVEQPEPDPRATVTGAFSLQKRLRWGLWATLLPVFAVLWFAASLTIHKLVENYLLTRLQHDADMLVTHLNRQAGQWRLDEQAISPIYHHPNSGHYFVIDADGQRFSSPSLAGYPLWTPPKPGSNPYETLAPVMLERPDASRKDALETVLVYVKHAHVDGHPVRIYVAEDHSPIQRYLYWFDAIFALVALTTLGFTAWLTRRLVRRTFASLSPLEHQLQRHTSGSDTFTLPDRLPSEVMSLACALEKSLRVQSEQLRRYRHANANLAHALKTPLHIIFQQLDHPGLQTQPKLKKRLQQQAERLRTLVERELKSARLAGGAWHGELFSLQQHLPELLEAIDQLYPAIHVSISGLSNDSTWPMEKEDAFELLGTIIDNACKWAQSCVSIRYQRHTSGTNLIVDDDGPGVPKEKRDKLINRGCRLDESRPGEGLGLTIADEILRRYSGRLCFSNSPSGGLRVTIHLPKTG